MVLLRGWPVAICSGQARGPNSNTMLQPNLAEMLRVEPGPCTPHRVHPRHERQKNRMRSFARTFAPRRVIVSIIHHHSVLATPGSFRRSSLVYASPVVTLRIDMQIVPRVEQQMLNARALALRDISR